MLEKSVNICAEDEKNEKKRKDNIKSVKIFSDEPEIGEAKADPETMKGAKVRINGAVFFMGDSVVMYANDGRSCFGRAKGPYLHFASERLYLG